MGQAASASKEEGDVVSPKDSREQHTVRVPRRRESIQVLPSTRATAVPPSESLESAHGSTNAHPLPHQSLDVSSAGDVSQHTRKRSHTTIAAAGRTGEHAVASDRINRLTPDAYARGGEARERSKSPSMPVSVAAQQQDPQARTHPANTLPGSDRETTLTDYINSSFRRPPRLPLPIENNELRPGSPILSPEDVEGQIGRDEDESTGLARKVSMLSSTTVDEDDVGEEFKSDEPGTGPTLDTLIEWKDGGERVYVTGSYMGWNRKHRLHKHGPSKDPNAFSAIIALPAGTHHLAFLVDGIMRTSPALPTAVDYTNVLINYVEISADDIPKSKDQSHQQQHHSATISTRTAAITGHDVSESRGGEGHPQQQLPPTPDLKPTQRSAAPSAGPSGISSPIMAGTGVRQAGPNEPAQIKVPPTPSAATNKLESTGGARKAADTKAYHSIIPQFLLDLDAPEESSRSKRANAVMNTQPAPPSLPMFLNKSILNGSMPIRDDASVLILPNHTVLNHLATSSIKHNVLAVSATTRYRKKYVTTIMYRPTREDGD